MVDVGAKAVTERAARAEALLHLPPLVERALREATLAKGDAFVTAQVAGIMAAKRTAELIPLCHALPLSSVAVSFEWAAEGGLRVLAEARTAAQTGVEMEAMTAVSVAALTIYDMAKAVDKGIDDHSASACSENRRQERHWTAP